MKDKKKLTRQQGQKIFMELDPKPLDALFQHVLRFEK